MQTYLGHLLENSCKPQLCSRAVLSVVSSVVLWSYILGVGITLPHEIVSSHGQMSLEREQTPLVGSPFARGRSHEMFSDDSGGLEPIDIYNVTVSETETRVLEESHFPPSDWKWGNLPHAILFDSCVASNFGTFVYVI